MKTKRILITGASGFVGRQVLRNLSNQNVHITVVLRDEKKNSFRNNPTIETVILSSDLFAETASWWAEILKGVDTIVHIAWYAEPGLYLQSTKNMDCIQGTLNLAKGAAEAGVRRFVGIGTCFEYDLSQGILSVTTALKPLTPYAGAKAASYYALSHWLTALSIEFVWCRLFYLYGDGEDPRRLVPYLRAKLAAGERADLTSGNQIRDFIDVEEAGRLIACIALDSNLGPVNICSGVPVTVRQIAENIADEYGRRDLLNFNARKDNLIDPPCVIGVPNYKSD